MALRQNILTQGGELKALGNPVMSRPSRPDKRNRGRPGLSTLQYAELAVRYEELEELRTGGESTRRRLAQEFGVAETTVAKRLQSARALGYLQPAKEGRRGGYASDNAHRIVKASGGKNG